MGGGLLWNPLTRYVATKLNGLTSFVPPPPREEGAPPRRILLVHAHPCDDSFSSAIANAVAAGARQGGHTLRCHSLYKQQYEAALTANERRAHLDRNKAVGPDVARALEDLRWADSVVFVYPTWWFNVPGILKGWFDRTLCLGGAFDLPISKDDTVASNGLVPLLTNVKRIAAISTYGAPRHIAFLAGDNGRNTISTAVRPVFDPSCTCLFLGLYNIDQSTQKDRDDFLRHVRQTIADDF